MVVETVDHVHVKMKKIVGFLTAPYSSHYELDLLLQKHLILRLYKLLLWALGPTQITLLISLCNFSIN